MAVDATYDTSRSVIAHEIIWQKLQFVFARNGRLALKSVAEADAIVLTHVLSSSSKQTGADAQTPLLFEDKLFNPARDPLTPQSFKNLNRADNFSRKEDHTVLIEVHIIERRNQQTLFKKTYTVNWSRNLYGNVSAPESRFIKSEEGYLESFNTSIQIFAENVVADLMNTAGNL